MIEVIPMPSHRFPESGAQVPHVFKTASFENWLKVGLRTFCEIGMHIVTDIFSIVTIRNSNSSSQVIVGARTTSIASIVAIGRHFGQSRDGTSNPDANMRGRKMKGRRHRNRRSWFCGTKRLPEGEVIRKWTINIHKCPRLKCNNKDISDIPYLIKARPSSQVQILKMITTCENGLCWEDRLQYDP